MNKFNSENRFEIIEDPRTYFDSAISTKPKLKEYKFINIYFENENTVAIDPWWRDFVLKHSDTFDKETYEKTKMIKNLRVSIDEFNFLKTNSIGSLKANIERKNIDYIYQEDVKKFKKEIEELDYTDVDLLDEFVRFYDLDLSKTNQSADDFLEYIQKRKKEFIYVFVKENYKVRLEKIILEIVKESGNIEFYDILNSLNDLENVLDYRYDLKNLKIYYFILNKIKSCELSHNIPVSLKRTLDVLNEDKEKVRYFLEKDGDNVISQILSAIDRFINIKNKKSILPFLEENIIEAEKKSLETLDVIREIEEKQIIDIIENEENLNNNLEMNGGDKEWE